MKGLSAIAFLAICFFGQVSSATDLLEDHSHPNICTINLMKLASPAGMVQWSLASFEETPPRRYPSVVSRFVELYLASSEFERTYKSVFQGGAFLSAFMTKSERSRSLPVEGKKSLLAEWDPKTEPPLKLLEITRGLLETSSIAKIWRQAWLDTQEAMQGESIPVLTDSEIRALRVIAIQDRLDERIIRIEHKRAKEQPLAFLIRVDNFSLGRTGLDRINQRLKVIRPNELYQKLSDRTTIQVMDLDNDQIPDSLVVTLPQNERPILDIVLKTLEVGSVTEEALRFVIPLAPLLVPAPESIEISGSEIYGLKRVRLDEEELADPHVRVRKEKLRSLHGPVSIAVRAFTRKGLRSSED